MSLLCVFFWIASCPGTALKMHAFHPQKVTVGSSIANVPYWLMVEAPQGQVLALEPEPTAQHHSPLCGMPQCVSRALLEVWPICHLISCILTKSKQPCSRAKKPSDSTALRPELVSPHSSESGLGNDFCLLGGCVTYVSCLLDKTIAFANEN